MPRPHFFCKGTKKKSSMRFLFKKTDFFSTAYTLSQPNRSNATPIILLSHLSSSTSANFSTHSRTQHITTSL